MRYTRQQVSNVCRQYGVQILDLPVSIDGSQLLYGISGNESSFGLNTRPRHEPAFDVGGIYATSPTQKSLLALYGSDAACSFGPWQLMFSNWPEGTTPADTNDLDKCAVATLAFMNSLIRRFNPHTLSDIGSCWNAGHIQNPLSTGVQAYVNELAKNYLVPMEPQEVAP